MDWSRPIFGVVNDKWGNMFLLPVARWTDGLELHRSVDRYSRQYPGPKSNRHFIFLRRTGPLTPPRLVGDAIVGLGLKSLRLSPISWSDWDPMEEQESLHRHRRWLAEVLDLSYGQSFEKDAPAEFLYEQDPRLFYLLGEAPTLLLPDEQFLDHVSHSR